MHTLIHTGMRVPDPTLHVTSMQALMTECGVAFTASLYQGQTLLGTIENQGMGGPTHFHAQTVELERDVRALIGQCRDRDGSPVDEEVFVDTLIEERDYVNELDRFAKAKAKDEHKQLIRVFDAIGVGECLVFTYPHHLRMYLSVLEAAQKLTLPARAARAELWTGPDSGWVEFYRAPEQS